MMRNKIGTTLRLLLSITVLLLFSAGAFARDSAPRGSGRTRGEVELEAYDILNEEMLSLEELKGKVVLVNFWATWCGYCTMEIPDLIDLQTDYEDDLVIIGLSYDYDEETVLDYAEDVGINYPLIMGDNAMSEEFGGISGYPTTFVLDTEGIIQKTMVGYRSYEGFEDAILPYIE